MAQGDMETVLITSDDLTYAKEVILRSGLVAVPTDTVYGLAGNGLDADAVAKIYEVKGRPSIKPLILLVPDIDAAEAFCSEIPKSARKLAAAFWPGALTIVLPRSSNVPDIVTAGGDTVGIRCPDHPKALKLLKLAGVPLAAPSANISDMPSPKSAQDVLGYFDGKIDCVIDGGVCVHGFESTIIDLSKEPYKILRHGALPEEDIRRALMYTVGITGGTGAGKTTALSALESLGVLTLDCDAIYHELLENNMGLQADLDAGFQGVLRDGKIDRKRLGDIVFSDPAALQALNAITHKYVGAELSRRIAEWEANGGKTVAIDAIALIESGRDRKCDVIVGVTAPRELRIARIMARDGITREQAEMRINAQKPDSFFKENCDHILENNHADPKEFEEKCREFFIQLL